MDDAFVGQFMSSPVLTIDADTDIADAGRAMTAEGIKSIVVVDEDCHPEGILTSTDFVAIAGQSRDPTEVTVAEYMTREIVTTDAGTAVRDVAETMREHDVSHLPVVDDEGKVVGMLTATDLTAYLSGVADIVA